MPVVARNGKTLGPSKGEVTCPVCGVRPNFADLYTLCEPCWCESVGRPKGSHVPTRKGRSKKEEAA